MFKWLTILVGVLRSTIRPQHEFVLESLVLRQRFAIFKQRNPQPRPKDSDRLFSVLLRRVVRLKYMSQGEKLAPGELWPMYWGRNVVL